MKGCEDGFEPGNERLDIILTGTQYFLPIVPLEVNAQGECATSLMTCRCSGRASYRHAHMLSKH